MTVDLWYGSRSNNPGEQNVLIDLYNFLESQPDHFVLMSNFHAGAGHEIDLVVLKRDALFVVELKHFWDKLVGGKDGEWAFVRADGTRGGAFRNPYRQVRDSRFSWQKWCQIHKDEIAQVLGRGRDLRDLEPLEYIVLYPDLHADSQLEIGEHPVQAMGLPKFRTVLLMRTQPIAEFSIAEMRAIPPLLQLTRWHLVPPKQEDRTVRLDRDDFQAPPVRMLVARGHEFSLPVFHLEKDVVTVGRDTGSDLVISDESVSRQHAELRRMEGRWVVHDLGSVNGTHVSFTGDPHLEFRIQRDNALKNGSLVRFGHASYTLLLSE